MGVLAKMGQVGRAVRPGSGHSAREHFFLVWTQRGGEGFRSD